MAITCTPAALSAASSCLACDLTHKQLLAALVYIQCTVNKMSCTPATLAAQAECLKCALTEKQLLAALVYLVCSNGGIGSGQLVIYTTTDPTADGQFPANQALPAVAYKLDGTGPTFVWNTTTHIWN